MNSGMADIHNFNIRVYYEDTDAGGVVYYANYLKYAERARTEFLRSLGVNQIELFEKEKILFVVRNAEIDIKSPAKLDNLLDVETKIIERTGTSIFFEQNINFDKRNLCSIKVRIVCVNENFKPKRLPDFLK